MMYGRAYLLSTAYNKETSGSYQSLWCRLWGRKDTRFSRNLTIGPSYISHIRYLYRIPSRSSCLHLLCSTFMVRTFDRYIYRKVKGRFGRSSKPLDHLGGINPEERINVMQIVEELPETGSTLEDMDIFIG